MPVFDVSLAGASLDRIGRNLGFIRRIGESDQAFYGRVREGIGLGAPTSTFALSAVKNWEKSGKIEKNREKLNRFQILKRDI